MASGCLRRGAPGGTVGIWGLGPIGQMCVRVALHRGAGRVIGVDSVPERLEVARRHGAEVVDFREVQDVDDVVLDLTDGRGRRGDRCGGDGGVGIGRGHRAAEDEASARPAERAAHVPGGDPAGGTLSITGVYTAWVPFFPLGAVMDRQLTMRVG